MGFVMPHVMIMVATIVAGVALLLQIVGLATTGWVSVEVANIETTVGLWELCIEDNCADLENVDDWVDACRAFGILAVLILVGAVVCGILICFMSSLKILPLVAMGCAAGGAFCAMIEFAVFAGEAPTVYTDNLSYSFALTIVAFILAAVAAVLFFLGKSKAVVE